MTIAVDLGRKATNQTNKQNKQQKCENLQACKELVGFCTYSAISTKILCAGLNAIVVTVTTFSIPFANNNSV